MCYPEETSGAAKFQKRLETQEKRSIGAAKQFKRFNLSSSFLSSSLFFKHLLAICITGLTLFGLAFIHNGEEKPASAMTFAVFTDTHVGQRIRNDKWGYADHLDLLAQDIMNSALTCEFVVHLGDGANDNIARGQQDQTFWANLFQRNPQIKLWIHGHNHMAGW